MELDSNKEKTLGKSLCCRIHLTYEFVSKIVSRMWDTFGKQKQIFLKSLILWQRDNAH